MKTTEIELLECKQCKKLGLTISGRLITQVGCGPWYVKHTWTTDLERLIEDLQEVHGEQSA